MLDAELLALLVCPETHQDLTLGLPLEVERLNEAIRAGQVRKAGGEVATEPVEGVLIRTDRAVAYPIRDDIPVMLVPEGLVITGLNLTTGEKASADG